MSSPQHELCDPSVARLRSLPAACWYGWIFVTAGKGMLSREPCNGRGIPAVEAPHWRGPARLQPRGRVFALLNGIERPEQAPVRLAPFVRTNPPLRIECLSASAIRVSVFKIRVVLDWATRSFPALAPPQEPTSPARARYEPRGSPLRHPAALPQKSNVCGLVRRKCLVPTGEISP